MGSSSSSSSSLSLSLSLSLFCNPEWPVMATNTHFQSFILFLYFFIYLDLFVCGWLFLINSMG
jgi:hypothetical protein